MTERLPDCEDEIPPELCEQKIQEITCSKKAYLGCCTVADIVLEKKCP